MNFLSYVQSILLVISFFFGSLFNLPDSNVNTLIDNNGGFIYGVCHPNEQYDMLKDAGLTWVRFDIPCPYDRWGNITKDYLDFKDRCRGYLENGIQVLAVTPYPRDYIGVMGFNPVENEENIQKTKELAVFLYNDLKDITGGFQITNEMGTGTFMLPLNIEQAALYIGIQLEAISAVKDDDFPIGYNSAGVVEELYKLMKPYHKYCDYVGVDLYIGNVGNARPRDYANAVREVYSLTQKPVMLMEFGFVSEGEKTDAQKAEILEYYGYSSEADAIADGIKFIEKLPTQFQNNLALEYPGQESEWASIVFKKYKNHLYGITTDKTICNIRHTVDGQAKYFTKVIAELKNLNCLAGMFVYCCQDMEVCFYCGHTWCPYETRWGLFDLDGNPKPSYYAVKEAITGSNDSKLWC